MEHVFKYLRDNLINNEENVKALEEKAKTLIGAWGVSNKI